MSNASGMSRFSVLSKGFLNPTPSRFFLPENYPMSETYLCYIDESGTPQIPGNTSHYVLAGIAIPIYRWIVCDQDIVEIKKKYALEDTELHTAWLLRDYREQRKIPDFANLTHDRRRSAVIRERSRTLYRLQRAGNSTQYKQIKRNLHHTDSYIHLTLDERRAYVTEVATQISKWGFARLFAECIDKLHFDPDRSPLGVDETAFEQVIHRFELFLQNANAEDQNYGMLIHDNNQTVAKRHTELMKMFHQRGTFWGDINHIIETPLFVDSQLTSMVQIADLCSYSIRRYLENGEDELFNLVFQRAHRRGRATVGVRHFSERDCECVICSRHRYLAE